MLENKLNIKPYHMFPLNFCNMYNHVLPRGSKSNKNTTCKIFGNNNPF